MPSNARCRKAIPKALYMPLHAHISNRLYSYSMQKPVKCNKLNYGNFRGEPLKPYSVFAKYYDALTANVNYHSRAAYFRTLINRHNTSHNNILLDLGCGTGSLARLMAECGYDVIGVDNSCDMLNIAMSNHSHNPASNVQYICQDMRNLDLFGTVGITLCALDSINHLPSLKDIERVFNRVKLFTESGGVFIFDVNTVYKHNHILSDNVFIYETDDVYCIWENSLNKINNAVDINLTFFEREGELYRRYHENFTEHAYEFDEISAILKNVGFTVAACYDADKFDSPHEKSERIVIVAKKG